MIFHEQAEEPLQRFRSSHKPKKSICISEMKLMAKVIKSGKDNFDLT